ncbi:MAG: poly(3-hydroxybutyrate) depolymerase, partial [Anaerolineae bacterium]|nr:poly(3-hydroxybutyrate) depolymerase [Anaerolineae bacterium]
LPLESGGIPRSYYVYLPASYDATTRVPLVLAFHGFAQGALGLAGYSGWEAIAEEYGFVLVYPQGTGPLPRWESSLFPSERQAVDDVAFVRDLIAHLGDMLCIDATRVYANGLSNGGGMSYRLACELSDHITAIGGVAGAYSDLPNGCNPSRPVPIIIFHGTEDSIVPYTGSDNDFFHLPSLDDFVLGWAERNGCDVSAPEITPQEGDVSMVRYTNCENNADVLFYTIHGGGHTWPGATLTRLSDRFGGYVTQDISASATMWAFFSQYALGE